MKHDSNKTPLWMELNEKRTQQIWDCHANNEIHPKGDEDGVFIIADFSNFDIDESVPKVEQAANAEYTALAVNNLARLAEALEAAKKELRLLNVTEDGGQKRNTPASLVISQIETALLTIS